MNGWRNGLGLGVAITLVAVTACSSTAKPIASPSTTAAAGTTATTATTSVVATATTAAGATTTGATGATTPPAGSVATLPPAGPTVLDGITAQIGDDGTIPLAAARQMFQLAYGTLSGVTLPSGATDPVIFGTYAMAAMEQHRSELSAADAAALDDVENDGGPVSFTVEPTTTAPSDRTAHLSPSAGGQRPLAPTCALTKPSEHFGKPLPDTESDVADFNLRVAHWVQVIGAALGAPLGLPVQVAVFASAGPTVNAAGTAAEADAWTYDDQCGGGRPSTCRIRLFAGARTEGDVDRDDTVAHELWHCFEAVAVGSRKKAYAEPDWIIEGEATWVAAKVTKSTSTWWTKYLRASETNLFKRSYDAIGFYASMESDGAPMFASLAQILEGGVISSGAAYKVALAAAPQSLLDNIGSMFFEDQSALDWHYRTTTGNPPPYNPGGLIPDAVDVSVGKGISVPLTVGPRSARLLRIHPTSDFVHIVASGHASSLDDAGTETHEISDNWLCTHEDPKDCQCPENTTGQAPDSAFASGDIRFAEAAGDDPETATVAGASIDDFCKDEDKYCADVKRLAGFETRDQAAIANGSVNPASPAFLQQAITDRVAVLHDMSADAPAEIAPHVKPYEAGYDKYAAVFAAAGYDVSKASRTDADAAINALAAVTRTDLPVIISDAKTRCDIVIPQASPR